MEDALQYQRDLTRERRNVRALPPLFPGNSAVSQNPSADRRTFEAQRTRARAEAAAQEALEEMYPPSPTPQQKKESPTFADGSNPTEERVWTWFWDGIMMALKILFTSLFWTLVVPVFLAPIIFVLYTYRLIAVNLLHKEKPVRFPILGIVDILVTKIDRLKIPTALAWILAGFITTLVATVAVGVIIFLLTSLANSCSALGSLCALLPKVY